MTGKSVNAYHSQKNRSEAVLNTYIFVLSHTFKNTVNMNDFTAVDFLEWDEIEH